MIVNEPSYSNFSLNDKNVESYVSEFCESAKKNNLGVITLHTASKEIKSCNFKNAINIRFTSKMKMFYSIQDERFLVLEQFIRQFKLWSKYK